MHGTNIKKKKNKIKYWIMVFETNLMFVAVPECYLLH